MGGVVGVVTESSCALVGCQDFKFPMRKSLSILNPTEVDVTYHLTRGKDIMHKCI
jgi:hypothetical protein